jgi:hypothetical protein
MPDYVDRKLSLQREGPSLQNLKKRVGGIAYELDLLASCWIYLPVGLDCLTAARLPDCSSISFPHRRRESKLHFNGSMTTRQAQFPPRMK